MTDTATVKTQPATIMLDGTSHELPVVIGTENEKAVDVTNLRSSSGYITLDPGYGNTGSCLSAITFIDGEQGILRYRGYPIQELAEKSTFVETAYLIIFGELPTRDQLAQFSKLLTESAMINAMGAFNPALIRIDNDDTFKLAAARLISKVRTIAAYAHKTSIGQPFIYPIPHLRYSENFLHMMFSVPNGDYQLNPDVVRALDLILILHADHEQNCSTSTVRMVASSGANLFASVSAGVCALWGPLHGGANVAVIEMLREILRNKWTVKQYLEKVKDPNSKTRLMGFGHRVYKNFDPRSRIIKESAGRVLKALGIQDAELELAQELEAAALEDEYFVERKLYPNVDFYSGMIMRAIGIPLDMFTVMFAIGRMPGWIANWREVQKDPKGRIYRPRQVYTGAPQRPYVEIKDRG